MPSCRFCFLMLAALATPSAATAAVVPWTPSDPVIETSSLREVFDDDVDFTTGGEQNPTDPVAAGNTIVWNQKYKNQYKVLSTDRADIDELTLFGDGADAKVEILFYLTDQEGKELAQTRNSWSLNWPGAINLRVADDSFSGAQDGDDLLGNLSGKIVNDFHVEVKVTQGTLGFAGGRLFWEAGDIERVEFKAPEPSAPSLVALALVAVLVSALRGRKPV